MEIVIEIREELYNTIMCSPNSPTLGWYEIAHGTVLPKGHGRLIDADCLNTGCGIRAFDCVGDCDKCSDRVVSYNEIENAETIVEADKG